jgi:hypothetical protein
MFEKLRNKGWFESADHTGKAPLHKEAAIRNKYQKDKPLTVPMFEEKKGLEGVIEEIDFEKKEKVPYNLWLKDRKAKLPVPDLKNITALDLGELEEIDVDTKDAEKENDTEED